MCVCVYVCGDCRVRDVVVNTHNCVCVCVCVLSGTDILQIFFYDPDGNGVELGNFDLK